MRFSPWERGIFDWGKTLVVRRKSKALEPSPRATGPAGSQFEILVGVHYALAVLARTEAFGLPGAFAEEIAFQRGNQGHPLDDVILRGVSDAGEARILDVQVKRSMAFTQGDANFAAVVKAIVDTRRDETDGKLRRYAVAIERTSRAIENGVQEALDLAWSVESGETFFTLLNAPGRSNDDMRRFVDAFRILLKRNGVDDESELFAVLTRFSVLVFDFARPNSIAEAHDRARARMLTSAKADRDLYDALYKYVSRLDSIGGGKNREGLIENLREDGALVAGAPGLAKARARLDEMAEAALSDINETVQGASLTRMRRNREIEAALDAAAVSGGVVEITGLGGFGKSALLKTQARRRCEACRILVLAPDRTPKGGWAALRHELEIDASAADFFVDLACDGGGILCIDGLDRFRDSGERKTVIDMLRSATQTWGVEVLFSARPGWDDPLQTWLPDDVRQRLANRRTIVVDELDDEEAEALGAAVPSLAALLKPDHAAKTLARNPFILKRLAVARSERIITEAQLATDWWATGGHAFGLAAGEQHACRRVLVTVAREMIKGSSLVDVSDRDPHAIEALKANEILAELGATDRVRFCHDLYSDWAIGCYLSDDTGRIAEIALGKPPPYWLGRAFELACGRIAEEPDDTAFGDLLDRLSGDSVAPSWPVLALLAVARSEQGPMLLDRYEEALLHGDGERGAALIRRALASDSQPAAEALAGVLPDEMVIPEGLTLAFGPVWGRLVVWTVRCFERLPAKTMAATLDLYEKWIFATSMFGVNQVTELLLERVADLLVAHVEDNAFRMMTVKRGALPRIRYPVSDDGVKTARFILALHAHHAPGAAARYLESIRASEQTARYLDQLLEFTGSLPAAAPAAFADVLRKAIDQDVDADEDSIGRRQRHEPFWRFESPFVLGRAGIGLFSALMKADEAVGLTLIRDLLRHAEDWVRDPSDGFDLELFGVTRRIAPLCSYGWSRGVGPSPLLSKALAALEQWGHDSVEGGRSLDDVVALVLGDGKIGGGLLLIAVDLVLSHGKTTSPVLWDLLASPEILALDAERFHRDHVNQTAPDGLFSGTSGESAGDQQVLDQLKARSSRGLALHDAIQQVAWTVDEAQLQPLRTKLGGAVQRLGGWNSERVEWYSPCFMASHALSLLNRDNYKEVRERDANDRETVGMRFVWPEQQRRWLESKSVEVAEDQASFSQALAVRMAMNDDQSDVRATVEMADAVLAETEGARPDDADEIHDPKDPWINRIAAGAFVARFGSDELLSDRCTDLNDLFDQALEFRSGADRHSHPHVMYNPEALALTGLLYLASRSGDAESVRHLLRSIPQHRSGAAAAFIHHRSATKGIGFDVVQAAVRIGIEACLIPRRQGFDEAPEVFEAREAAACDRRSERLAIEQAWLAGEREQPDWPCPSPRRPRRRRRSIRLPGGAPKPAPPPRKMEWPDFYFDDQTAASWTRCLSFFGPEASIAVKALITANKDWMIQANSSDDDTEMGYDDRRWTKALMERAAQCAKAWSMEERHDLVFEALTSFSDEAFIDAATAFLVQSDLRHIEGKTDDTAYLVELRKTIWARLKQTRHWGWQSTSPSDGMEIHLKRLIAAFFFRIDYGFGSGERYTGGLGESQLLPFFPILTEIAVEAGASPVSAMFFLDAVEAVEPRLAAPFVLVAASAWVAGGTPRFWNEYGFGRRVCLILSAGQITSENVPQLLIIADAVSAAGVSEGQALRVAVQKID